MTQNEFNKVLEQGKRLFVIKNTDYIEILYKTRQIASIVKLTKPDDWTSEAIIAKLIDIESREILYDSK